jgi:hypothetical protein
VTASTRGVASVCTVPTDGLESDGALEWTSTTIVVVEVQAGGASGLGVELKPADAGRYAA